MSGALANALTITRDAERMRAARVLLARPLLRADGNDAEDFAAIRRHAQYLRDWHLGNTGWSLLVDTELARLVKSVESHQGVSQQGAAGEHTHPAVDASSKAPFTRRRYVLFCLALAALSRADTQITLGRLAEQVVLGAADPSLADAGIMFALDQRDQRSDLVAVVRLLIECGALTRVAGEEDAFLDHSGDVLYDVRRRVLSALLATGRGPSTVPDGDGPHVSDQRLRGLTEHPDAATEDLRHRQLRHRLTRLLLDEPVLYYDELTPDELTFLTGQRASITGKITAFTGLVAEVRREGIAMVDPHGDLTDVHMPEVGTDGHATLLIADHLATAGRPEVPIAELRAWLREQALIFVAQHLWRKATAVPGAEAQLLETVLGRLEALRLIHRDADTVRLRPAIARYGMGEPTIAGLPETTSGDDLP